MAPSREVELAPREVAVEVPAERDRSLLPVHNLERSVGVPRPVHDVEREPLHHRRDDGVALLLAVYELALVCGADVEPSAEPPYSGLRVVDVSFDELAHRYLVQFDLHGSFIGFGLRQNYRILMARGMLSMEPDIAGFGESMPRQTTRTVSHSGE